MTDIYEILRGQKDEDGNYQKAISYCSRNNW